MIDGHIHIERGVRPVSGPGGGGAHSGRRRTGHRRYPHRDAFEGGGGAGTAVPQGHWGSAFAGCESAAQVHRRGSGQI